MSNNAEAFGVAVRKLMDEHQALGQFSVVCRTPQFSEFQTSGVLTVPNWIAPASPWKNTQLEIPPMNKRVLVRRSEPGRPPVHSEAYRRQDTERNFRGGWVWQSVINMGYAAPFYWTEWMEIPA